jgi:hypothetical protein
MYYMGVGGISGVLFNAQCVNIEVIILMLSFIDPSLVACKFRYYQAECFFLASVVLHQCLLYYN